jgi:hypothetical protein
MTRLRSIAAWPTVCVLATIVLIAVGCTKAPAPVPSSTPQEVRIVVALTGLKPVGTFWLRVPGDVETPVSVSPATLCTSRRAVGEPLGSISEPHSVTEDTIWATDVTFAVSEFHPQLIGGMPRVYRDADGVWVHYADECAIQYEPSGEI